MRVEVCAGLSLTLPGWMLWRKDPRRSLGQSVRLVVQARRAASVERAHLRHVLRLAQASTYDVEPSVTNATPPAQGVDVVELIVCVVSKHEEELRPAALVEANQCGSAIRS